MTRVRQGTGATRPRCLPRRLRKGGVQAPSPRAAAAQPRTLCARNRARGLDSRRGASATLHTRSGVPACAEREVAADRSSAVA